MNSLVNKTNSYDKPVNNDMFSQNMDEMKQKSNSSSKSPSEIGNTSISGYMPDLESDDDVLQNAHQMGIAPNAYLEHPKELNIAKNIEELTRI